MTGNATTTLTQHGARVSLRGVARTFAPAVKVVEDVSLTVEPGEFVALLGPSGCGKSTLLRLIADLDHPTGGAVDVRYPDHGDQQRRIAYVFQDAHLLPWRTVEANAALPLELIGVPKQQRLEAARESLAQLGLGDAFRRYPSQLSGGMRMRVSLARALVVKPALLLLDEPFAALDELTRQRLDEQLRELWQQHPMTILFVTHSIAEAVFLADRAVVFTPRPARVILDQRLSLPSERKAELRTCATFAEQLDPLRRALEQGEAMS